MQLLLENGTDFHVVNGRGLTATDVVSMEFGVELEGISRHVYESLGIKFNAEYVRQTRLQIAEILRKWQSENMPVDSR